MLAWVVWSSTSSSAKLLLAGIPGHTKPCRSGHEGNLPTEKCNGYRLHYLPCDDVLGRRRGGNLLVLTSDYMNSRTYSFSRALRDSHSLATVRPHGPIWSRKPTVSNTSNHTLAYNIFIASFSTIAQPAAQLSAAHVLRARVSKLRACVVTPRHAHFPPAPPPPLRG